MGEWVGMVVWLLASGQFQGEPWQRYETQEACETAHAAPFYPGNRMLFFTGCVNEVAAKGFGSVAFSSFSLVPGK